MCWPLFIMLVWSMFYVILRRKKISVTKDTGNVLISLLISLFKSKLKVFCTVNAVWVLNPFILETTV